MKPLLPLFTQLLADSRTTYTTLRISVFYTRALASPDAMKAFERLPLGLTISPGRPRLHKLLEGVADRTAGSGGMEGLTGVVVGVCGPPALGSSVEKAVRGLDRQRRSAVGGVELHEECVSFLLTLGVEMVADASAWCVQDLWLVRTKLFQVTFNSMENRWMLEAPTAGNTRALVLVLGDGDTPCLRAGNLRSLARQSLRPPCNITHTECIVSISSQ